MSKSWNGFWKHHIEDHYDGVSDLLIAVQSHPYVYAQLAALDAIDLDRLDYEESAAALKTLNGFLPDNPHVMIACDQKIRLLDRMVDEFDRGDWKAELHDHYTSVR